MCSTNVHLLYLFITRFLFHCIKDRSWPQWSKCTSFDLLGNSMLVFDLTVNSYLTLWVVGVIDFQLLLLLLPERLRFFVLFMLFKWLNLFPINTSVSCNWLLFLTIFNKFWRNSHLMLGSMTLSMSLPTLCCLYMTQVGTTELIHQTFNIIWFTNRGTFITFNS